jgi:DNA replication protein DnaC
MQAEEHETAITSCDECGKSFEYTKMPDPFGEGMSAFEPGHCDECAEDTESVAEDRDTQMQDRYEELRDDKIPGFYKQHLDGPVPAVLKRAIYHCYDASEWLGAYIHGEPGTGKTTFMCRALDRSLRYHIVDEGRYDHSARYTTELWLKHDLKSKFDDSSMSPQDALQDYMDADLLIIDEIGKASHTSWTLETLFMLVNQRQMNAKTTIFGSNYSLEALQSGAAESGLTGDSNFGADLTSKMWEMCGQGKYIEEMTTNWRAKSNGSQ